MTNCIRALLMLKGNVNERDSGIAAKVMAAGVFSLLFCLGIAAVIAASH